MTEVRKGENDKDIMRDEPNIRTNGRPTAQWTRLEAGRSDNLASTSR
jgi:hypothetical protein